MLKVSRDLPRKNYYQHMHTKYNTEKKNGKNSSRIHKVKSEMKVVRMVEED